MGGQKNFGVQFEEWKPSTETFKENSAKMIRWIIKNSGGVVKNKKQASLVLFLFSLIAFSVSLYLFFGIDASKDLKKIIPEKPYVDPAKPWRTR